MTPILWNFKSIIGKTCFLPVSPLTSRLDFIGDEIINNLVTKKVVCFSAVRNVGIVKKHQNDQVSTQELLVFSRGEYNERSEFLGANEDNVASSPNLEDLH